MIFRVAPLLSVWFHRMDRNYIVTFVSASNKVVTLVIVLPFLCPQTIMLMYEKYAAVTM